MNTSDLVRDSAHRSAPSLDYLRLAIPEDDLHAARRALYHSSGPGYVVFPNFLAPAHVAHMRSIWSSVDPSVSHARFQSKAQFQVGCPNFADIHADGTRIFHNFLWNPPLDEVTREASIFVHMLRNRLSGRNAFDECLPGAGKAVNYRVVISRNPNTAVALHRDYFDHARRMEKNAYDPSRLQATLFLSEKGRDYDGTGFRFTRNDGAVVVFGTDVPMVPGDLVIWKYTNWHAVEPVVSRPDQLGFMRIIYPPEVIHPAARAARQPTLADVSAFGRAAVRRVREKLVRRGRSLLAGS